MYETLRSFQWAFILTKLRNIVINSYVANQKLLFVIFLLLVIIALCKPFQIVCDTRFHTFVLVSGVVYDRCGIV